QEPVIGSGQRHRSPSSQRRRSAGPVRCHPAAGLPRAPGALHGRTGTPARSLVILGACEDVRSFPPHFFGVLYTVKSIRVRSQIGRNKEAWFLSPTAITGGFRPRNHPGAADKTSPRHPS